MPHSIPNSKRFKFIYLVMLAFDAHLESSKISSVLNVNDLRDSGSHLIHLIKNMN